MTASEPLGRGREKDVYEDPNDPGRVMGIYREDTGPMAEALDPKTPERMKALFYLTRIAKLLFPHNIATVKQTTTEPPTVIKERVHGTPYKGATVGDYAELDELRQQFLDAGLLADGDPANYWHDAEGHLVYIDDLDIDQHLETGDWRKIESTVTERLEGAELTQALEYLDRLKQLS